MEFLKPFAEYYYFVYWLIVLLLTISQFNHLKAINGYMILWKQCNYKPIVMFMIFYILFFGFRPISHYFGDMKVYGKSFELLQNFEVFDLEGSRERSTDVLFYTFQRLCAIMTVDVHVWFACIMFFYVVMMFWGCKKIDFRHGALLMLFCVGAFEFYSFSVNGIRNGVACSFAIMAVACLCKKEKLWACIWSIFAIGCHKSVALPVIAMFFTYYMLKPKYMYIAWGGAIILSLSFGEYIDNLLSVMSYDDRLAANLQGNDADGVIMEHRFRWDFLLYSSVPILLGWYTIFKRRLFDKTYLILLGTYIYSNAFWVLAIRAIFSNRIAYLSWFLYPMVLAYPLLSLPVFKKQHSKKTAWILLLHYGLTTFLCLIE